MDLTAVSSEKCVVWLLVNGERSRVVGCRVPEAEGNLMGRGL